MALPAGDMGFVANIFKTNVCVKIVTSHLKRRRESTFDLWRYLLRSSLLTAEETGKDRNNYLILWFGEKPLCNKPQDTKNIENTLAYKDSKNHVPRT